MTEQSSPEMEAPQAVSSQPGLPGQGQSKSSRRRRRKRNKTKVTPGANGQSGGEQAAEGGQSDGQTVQIQATADANQNGNGAGAKRSFKKKKFRSGSGGGQGYSNGGGQNANPGNGNGGGSQGRRRNKQKRTQSFVGPMDHSYRETNGNYADSPASTIEMHGNHGGGHHHHRNNGHQRGDTQAAFNLGSYTVAPPVKEDAATHIYCFVEDLFVLDKIQETGKKLGVKVAFIKNEKESLATLLEAPAADKPALIIFDLNNLNAKPMTLIPKLKKEFKRSASIVGFLSHLQGDLKAKAVEAGCDSVMPRSAFSQNLPNLLRRYGIEEEDEPNFNA